MKNYAKKLLLTAALLTSLASSDAFAATATMDASVATRTAINMVKNDDMLFGTLDVVIATQDRTVTLDPLTDAVSVTGGTVGTVVASGTAQSGKITITTDGATAIDVTCNTTTALGNGGGDTLTLGTISIQATVGATLASSTCNGTPVSVTPTAADIELGVGAALVLDTTTNNVAVGHFTYSTATGGTPLTVTAVYP